MLRTVPVWSDTLRDRGLVTIFVNSSLGEGQPGFIDRALNAIHVNATLLDDEDTLRDAVTAGFTALAPKRPQLAVVREHSSDPVESAPTAEPAPEPTAERPVLHLVRPEADCLAGCEHAAERATDRDGHLCSATVGAVDLRGQADRREQLSVSVERYQDDVEGAHSTTVAIGHMLGNRADEPHEMSPMAARALAAQLLAAADLAEQTNRQQGRSRQTA